MRRILSEYFYVTLGSVLCAIGVAYFVNPAKIASGGVSGIATMFYHTLGWNPGYVIFVLSVPLFLIGIRIFGRTYGIKSLIGTVLLSVFTSIFVSISGGDGFLDYSNPVSVLLSAVFGGVSMGAGIGFTIKGGSNTGGTDIIAQIINKYTPMSLGSALTLVDALVIFSSVFVFGVESALYAILTVYICGVSIDKVALMGAYTAKVVMFISEKNDEISEYLLKDLNHGATLLDAKGVYSGHEKPVLMAVVSNQELSGLTAKVKQIDDKAFMIVQNAYQVLGEGFTPISKVISLYIGK